MDIQKYGPWAFIAGGSEGVGAEFATQLADQGMNLVLLARKSEPLEKVAQECGAGVSTFGRSRSIYCSQTPSNGSRLRQPISR